MRTPKVPAVVDLPAAVADSGILRIQIQRGFRAPLRGNSITIEGLWRADLHEIRSGVRPKFLGTFVTDSSKDESPADLLRQLADIFDHSPLSTTPTPPA